MNPLREYAFRLVCLVVDKPQIIHLGILACSYLDTDCVLIVEGDTQVDGCGIDAHPADGECSLNRAIQEVRMHCPDLVGAGFPGKRCEAIGKGALSISEDLVGAVKAVKGNHEIQGDIGHGRLCCPLQRTTGYHDILIAGGAFRCDACHFTVIRRIN